MDDGRCKAAFSRLAFLDSDNKMSDDQAKNSAMKIAGKNGREIRLERSQGWGRVYDGYETYSELFERISTVCAPQNLQKLVADEKEKILAERREVLQKALIKALEIGIDREVEWRVQDERKRQECIVNEASCVLNQENVELRTGLERLLTEVLQSEAAKLKTSLIEIIQKALTEEEIALAINGDKGAVINEIPDLIQTFKPIDMKSLEALFSVTESRSFPIPEWLANDR